MNVENRQAGQESRKFPVIFPVLREFWPKERGYNGSLRKSPFRRPNDVGFVVIGATVLAGPRSLAPTAIVDRLPSLRET
jgi:hypothetical protein